MSDKGEILSEAEVDFLLSAGADEPATTPSASPDDQTVTMRGDLEQINLADIFQTLSMSKMEGVLRLRNPLEERQVHCRDGYVRLHVPARMATRRLGQRLIQAGVLDGEQLRTALVGQRKDKKPLGQVLANMGLVSQEAIDEIIGVQVAEDLFSLFTWRHGAFEFWKGPPPSGDADKGYAASPEYEVNSLLLEIARRSDEWQSILAAICSLEEVPRRATELAADADLTDLHRLVWAGADGHTTYRQIADHSTYGLFEVARAARDLARDGNLVNLDDGGMVTLAAAEADTGQQKRALMLLQTLRDRPGERALGILQGMAKAIEQTGERRLAGCLLLEAAQRQTDGTTAMDLARSARAMAPHDPEILSFLRTVLVAHSNGETDELEKCTLDLLDALIEADRTPIALEIVEDARRTGTVQAAILLREVRARQKSRDIEGATRVLEELAQLHDQRGERKLATDAYDALLRMDRSRKDVQKLLATRHRTRLGRWVRTGAFVAIAAMTAGMGLVFWQQRSFTNAVAAADQEITSLLQAGDRTAAQARLQLVANDLGACEAVEDFQNRVAFAEAAEAGRQQKLLRARVNSQIALAAESLAKGELLAAMRLYEEVWQEVKLREEVSDVVKTRFDALCAQITATAKGLETRLPPPPNELLDRRDLLTNLAELQSSCPPTLLRAFAEMGQMVGGDAIPPFLTEEQTQRARRATSEAKAAFAAAKERTTAYTDALQRNDHQRELDPLFKAAVEREAANDFAGALARYRELERHTTIDAELRTHFRDRVARNATIVRLLEALHAATTAGDFAVAQQQLRALRLSFADVAFDRLVRLPLLLESAPSGAAITCNGKVVGTTPMVLQHHPAEELMLSIALDGFRSVEHTVVGDDVGAFTAQLFLLPKHSDKHGSMIDAAPARTGDLTLVVDRTGTVSARDQGWQARWSYRSGDLSGLLTAPLVHDGQVIVGSLDGDLRALHRETGELLWSMPQLPTEVPVALVGQHLLLATTDRRLHRIDLKTREERAIELPVGAATSLFAHGNLAVLVGDSGSVVAFDIASMQARWQTKIPGQSHGEAVLGQGCTFISDEQGHVVCIALATGAVRWQGDLDVEVLGPPTLVGDDVLVVTRHEILRLDAASGRKRAPIAAADQHWHGTARVVNNRLVVPLADGNLQVLDVASGQALYRLQATKRARLHMVGDQLHVADTDHTVHRFGRLR